nr:uncharacterized protein LOC119180872 [Rhipicephalus microplus]
MAELSTCIRLIVLSVSVSAQIPYENNPENFAWQRASDITGVGERLHVKLRSRLLHEIPVCFALLGVLQHNANAFSYVVTYLAPGGISRHATRLVTSRTPYHPHQNAISFQLASGSPRMTRFKIMYVDPRRDCMILIKTQSRHRECILFQTSRTVDGPIPPECRQVYRDFCNHDSVLIYEPKCKEVFRHAPAHNSVR